MLSNSQWLAEWPIRLEGLILQSLGKQHLKVNVSEKGGFGRLAWLCCPSKLQQGLAERASDFFFNYLPLLLAKRLFCICADNFDYKKPSFLSYSTDVNYTSPSMFVNQCIILWKILTLDWSHFMTRWSMDQGLLLTVTDILTTCRLPSHRFSKCQSLLKQQS